MALDLGGAYGLQSFEDLLRQRMQDKIAAQQRQESIRQFNVKAGETTRAHDLNMKQHELALAQRGDVLAETARQNDIGQAGRMAENAMPEQPIDVKGAELLGKTGYGGMLRTVPSSTYEGVDQSQVTSTMQPGRLFGGTKWQTGEATRTLQEKLAADKLAAIKTAGEEKATTAAQRRQDVLGQQNITNEIARGNAATARMLAENTVSGRKEKVEEAARRDVSAQQKEQDVADEGLNTINKMLTHPGAQWAVGATHITSMVPGTAAHNYEALRKHLESILTVEKIGELKSQSKTGATGFGQLSEREGDILRTAIANLDAAQSPAQFNATLKTVQGVLGKMKTASQAMEIGRASCRERV